MEKVLKTNVLWAKRMLHNLQTQADFCHCGRLFLAYAIYLVKDPCFQSLSRGRTRHLDTERGQCVLTHGSVPHLPLLSGLRLLALPSWWLSL